MSLAETVTLVSYFFVLIILAFYGWHRYYVVYMYMKHRDRQPVPGPQLSPLPVVTVQLPFYNEMYVADRLIESICALDYPRDLLEIQVLDDSTDETTAIAAAAVERYRHKGFDITYLHRTDRSGFKAGALDEGLKVARGQFIAIFDADFTPDADFLLRLLPHFADPSVGMVQAHDTLTEDLDLSYRAQLRGWKFVFRPDVVAPAEVPVEMNAFKSQQHRWAKGSIQTCRKLLPTILASDVPFGVKAEAFFHLSANFNYPLMVLLSILMFPSMVIRYNMGWTEMMLIDVPLFFAATFSVCNFYLVCQREIHRDWKARIKYLPFLMSIGIGLCINNSRAVFEAMFNRQSEFARTPKYRIVAGADQWSGKKYRQSVAVQPLIELALGIYFTYTVLYALANGIYGTLPFLVLFQIGFLYTGVVSLLQQYGGSAPLLKPQVAGDK